MNQLLHKTHYRLSHSAKRLERQRFLANRYAPASSTQLCTIYRDTSKRQARLALRSASWRPERSQRRISNSGTPLRRQRLRQPPVVLQPLIGFCNGRL